MTPYYQDEWVTLYHGDCREIVPLLYGYDTTITDPVWPNASPQLIGHDRPWELFGECTAILRGQRLAVHLGCDSDPRFLSMVPPSYPFFRVAILEYARPSYRGRLLHGFDVAYFFGEPPPARHGYHLIPGRNIDSSSNGKQTDHPSPRKLGHAQWIVSRWSHPSDVILDPFAGSGTTLLASKNLGRKSIGVEIDEEYCRMTVDRLQQTVMDLGA